MKEYIKALKIITELDPTIWQDINWGVGDYKSIFEREIIKNINMEDLKDLLSFLPKRYVFNILQRKFKEEPMKFKEFASDYNLMSKEKDYLLWAWENEPDSRKEKLLTEIISTGILTKEFVKDNEPDVIEWLNNYDNFNRWERPDYEKVLRKFESKRLAVVVLRISNNEIKDSARTLLKSASVKVCHVCDANMRKATIKLLCNYCNRATHRACIRKEYFRNSHYIRSRNVWDAIERRWVTVKKDGNNNNPDLSFLSNQYCLDCKSRIENNVEIEEHE